MSKLSPVIQRVSPLADIAVQGRFGADKGVPGVTLSVRHPMSIVTVIARKGQSAALSKAIAAAYSFALPGVGQSAGTPALSFHWCGADQYYAVAEGPLGLADQLLLLGPFDGGEDARGKGGDRRPARRFL